MHAKQGGARHLASVHDRLERRDNRGARRAENDEIADLGRTRGMRHVGIQGSQRL